MLKLPRLSLPGTNRGRGLRETLDLINPYLKQAGITRVGVVSGLDIAPLPVVMVTRPLSASLSVTQGKGLTLEAAKVSGVMEAIEHFHAETVEGELCLATERELTGSRADTGSLAARSARYSPHARMLWQRARGLSSNHAIWVPFDLVHLDLRTRGPGGNGCFIPNSNGLASGNCLEEATVHALCEVIERHLTAEFYDMSVEEQERRRLVGGSVGDPACRSLIEALARAGLSTTIWDLTNDLQVPCFLCEVLGKHEPFRPVGAARGFGCHTDSGIALTRAISEAVQSRLTDIAGSRDDIAPQDRTESAMRDLVTRGQWQRRSEVPARHLFRSIPSHSFSSFDEECSWLVTRITSLGRGEPMLVDLSKRGWPVAVVRVIAPGLRFGPLERADIAPPNHPSKGSP